MTEYVHVKRERPLERKHHGKGGKGNRSQAQIDAANGKFDFDEIHGFKLIDVEYKVPPKREREARRSQFKGIRADFLREIGRTHEKELRAIGMNDAMIEMVKSGRTPKGYNVHHKLPIHGGGKNEFKNFILTPLYPHDQWHHDIIDPQIDGLAEGESRKIMLPYGDEMIFDPKKYGFTKDNQKVEPNYKSRVDPEKDCYAPNWLPEHIEAKRKAQKANAAVTAKILTAKMRAGR